MTEHFTERAGQALLRAREEARELSHSYVGTEHLLLALLGEDESNAANALRAAGVTHGQVQAAVVRMMGRGVQQPVANELVFTGRAEDTVVRARSEAAAAGQEQVGTEHILLALVGERDGAAVRILQQLDADPTAIRSALAS